MKTQTIRFLLLITLIFSWLTPSTITHAANLTVNSLADTIAADGKCTLREAIQNANNNAETNADCAAGSGSDTITFSLSGTITLGTILPTIADAAGLTLDGTGQAVTISGNNVSRIAVVPPSASLTLNHMTIANGYTSDHGGAILSSGTLVILNSVFSENSAYYFGGGIFNSGTLTITNSVFSGNTANKGGGIYNDAGALTITSSTFFNNSASGGEGGGINVFSGNLTITDSTFNQNSASLGSGGGIYNAVGTLTITNSTFSENTANYGEGGGIYNSYDLTIKSSTFTNNSSGSGGGILNSGAYLTVANSTFSGNNVSASGVNGGGILNEDHGLVVNSTFSGNSAPDGGGAIGSTNSHLTLRNTIVANSVSGGNCAGTITNGGSNLDDGVTCGWGSAFGSISDTNPDLGAPVGSPAYFSLNAGSPAIDKGDDPICAASPVNNQSQNGVTRPQGAHCDIGSYEFVDTIPPTVQTITRADTNPISAASVHFRVTFSEAVTGVDTSDFALAVLGMTGTSITGVSGGATAYTVTVNTGSGTGTIRLDVVDNDTIMDLTLNLLGGAGAGNGSYTSGETYDVRFYRTYLPLVFKN